MAYTLKLDIRTELESIDGEYVQSQSSPGAGQLPRNLKALQGISFGGVGTYVTPKPEGQTQAFDPKQ